MVLGTVAAYANPPVVYASNPAYVAPAPVVYQQPAVVYQQPSPNVVYVQAPQPQTNVVYAPAPQPQTTVVSAPPAQQTTVVEQAAAPVQQIQVPATTQTPNSQSYAVRFRNPNGSVTVVPLTQSGTGWFGPQGEYYVSFPTDEQIRALYCK